MELMVASDEIIDMVKRILRGIPVNDETMALDVIADVGPGGHYLEHDHTYERFRTEIWRPKFLDRQRWDDWTVAGSKRHSKRVHEKVIEILEADSEPLMEEAMVNELRTICKMADSRHTDEELDIKFV
jgi:trimethylamine--corrinoid protein Co-methyltransferase